jgi:two-component system sensor kinase FixL
MSYRRFFANLALAAILAAVYFGAAKLGLALAFVNASATAVWPPTGIALAALLVLGNRVWPGILLGALLANITTAGSVATSLGIAIGNTLEGLVGAYLVQRFANGRSVFDRSRDVFTFVIFAGIVSTAVSATLGVTVLCLGGLASWANYGPIWLTWWLGDAVGALVVTPPLVLWSVNPRLRWNLGQVLEIVILLLALLLVGLTVFGRLFLPRIENYPLEFICIPLLIWAAFRFGQREAATAACILSGIAIWGTIHGSGPFIRDDPNESLLLLQVFMGIVAVMSLVLAAAVAERKQADETLRKSKAQIEAILQGVSDGISVQDGTGRLVYTNDMAAQMSGYASARALLEAPLAEVIQQFEILDETGRPFPLEQLPGRLALQDLAGPETLVRFRVRATGEERWSVVKATPIYDDYGQAQLAINTFHDITAHKQAEGALRQATEELETRVAARTADLQVALGRMEALYTVTRTAIASEHWPVVLQQVVDCVATAIPANRVSLIIFDQHERRVIHFICGGPGREHVVTSVSFDELLDGLTGWVMREGRSARSPKGAPDPRESAAVHQRRAETNCGAIAVAPLRYQDQVLGTITAINLPEERDFSEADIELIEAIAGQVAIAHVRASLYERLQHTTARLAGILDIADDAIIAVNGRQEIELFNQGAERIFGYTTAEVLGQPLDMLLPTRAAETHRQHVQTFAASAAVARRMGERHDIFGRRRDGTQFPAEASISKLTSADEPVFTVILRDITERKRAEDALKTSAIKLEHRNRELQEFASVASHDLQEPLRKVQAFGDLLKTEYAATLDVEGRDYLERIQNAASRMQTLINDLLLLARLGSEARPFVMVDLNRVAHEVLADLEARIVRTGGRVELGDLPTIEADPLQMRQLLQNVIGNALKFSRPEQPPLVRIRNQLIAGAEPRRAASVPGDSCCQISVEDNGIGFDEKYLDRIFAVFQRLHGRGEYEGTGIGLAVCRRIVERHGGSITATSTLGQGTTFIITLPVNQPSGRNDPWNHMENSLPS